MHKIRNKYATKYAEYEQPPFLYAEFAGKNAKYAERYAKYAKKYVNNTQNTQKSTQHPFEIRRIRVVTCSYSAYSAYACTPRFADDFFTSYAYDSESVIL